MVEDFFEVKQTLEILRAVFLLLGENADVDEREHDLAEIIGRVNAPVFQNGSRQGAESLDRKVPGTVSKLLAGYVTPFAGPGDHRPERIKKEIVRQPVIARVAFLKPVQNQNKIAGVHDDCNFTPSCGSRQIPV